MSSSINRMLLTGIFLGPIFGILGYLPLALFDSSIVHDFLNMGVEAFMWTYGALLVPSFFISALYSYVTETTGKLPIWVCFAPILFAIVLALIVSMLLNPMLSQVHGGNAPFSIVPPIVSIAILGWVTARFLWLSRA